MCLWNDNILAGYHHTDFSHGHGPTWRDSGLVQAQSGQFWLHQWGACDLCMYHTSFLPKPQLKLAKTSKMWHDLTGKDLLTVWQVKICHLLMYSAEDGSYQMLWHFQWSPAYRGGRAVGGLSAGGIFHAGLLTDSTSCVIIALQWQVGLFTLSCLCSER